jgi:DNA adenine methylase Dam
MKTIKKTCPFNYAGSKSLYNELFEVEKPIADLFGGGGGFWSNVKSSDIIVNDVCSPLIRFQKRIYEASDEQFEGILAVLNMHTNQINSKEKYEKLRSMFNETKDDLLFMCCLSCCTNNLIRFNKSGGFNQTWGQRKFNPSMESKLRDFRNRIKDKKIQFSIGDFQQIDTTGRILFVDPPYLISSAGYNTSWTAEDEKRLYSFLNGKDFILTNFLFRGDIHNTILEDFIRDNKLNVKVIKEGQMKAQKDDTIFQEVAVSNLPFGEKKQETITHSLF